MTYNMYKDVKKEGDIMNNYEKIKSLLEKNNGILYVKELEKNNIHRQYLKILEERCGDSQESILNSFVDLLIEQEMDTGTIQSVLAPLLRY